MKKRTNFRLKTSGIYKKVLLRKGMRLQIMVDGHIITDEFMPTNVWLETIIEEYK